MERKEELAALEKLAGTVFSFSRKSQRLGQMQKSFFEKYLAAQKESITAQSEQESSNAQAAMATYFKASLRAGSLFSHMTKNLLKSLEEHKQVLIAPTPGSQNEVYRFFEMINAALRQGRISSNDVGKTQLQFTQEQETQLLELRKLEKQLKDSSQFLDLLEEELYTEIFSFIKIAPETIVQLEHHIETINNLLLSIETRPERLAAKLQEEHEVYTLLTFVVVEEAKLFEVAERMQTKLQNFLGSNIEETIKEHLRVYENLLLFFSSEFGNHLRQALATFPALQDNMKILEKHADKFTAIVLLLSSTTCILSLCNLSVPTPAYLALFGVLASGGESFMKGMNAIKTLFPNVPLHLRRLSQAASFGQRQLMSANQ
ncbi:hypothetical protein H6501_02925 [Candidatus Woesearchaeota archaeon]|nr:hypothetical protein [Nanoarchaeota archaeon]MCB9370524.1 hypothetical protein [Candidatus Woesearchaeota archaeon]USN43600.1 MAG: hypothetical protein H6500_04370 [Candidatus Woesearchaeota archaeon]